MLVRTNNKYKNEMSVETLRSFVKVLIENATNPTYMIYSYMLPYTF